MSICVVCVLLNNLMASKQLTLNSSSSPSVVYFGQDAEGKCPSN